VRFYSSDGFTIALRSQSVVNLSLEQMHRYNVLPLIKFRFQISMYISFLKNQLKVLPRYYMYIRRAGGVRTMYMDLWQRTNRIRLVEKHIYHRFTGLHKNISYVNVCTACLARCLLRCLDAFKLLWEFLLFMLWKISKWPDWDDRYQSIEDGEAAPGGGWEIIWTLPYCGGVVETAETTHGLDHASGRTRNSKEGGHASIHIMVETWVLREDPPSLHWRESRFSR